MTDGSSPCRSGERVTCSKEMPEQAVPIEIAGEDADTSTTERAALVPIGTRGGVELCAQALIIDAKVRARVGASEETEESLIVGEILQRVDLELSERDMRAVEVDRGDRPRDRR